MPNLAIGTTDSVAALCPQAIAGTAIRIGRIAIITFLKTTLSSGQISSQNAIATTRRPTIATTAIGVIVVGVIAKLALAHQAITADHDNAIRSAGGTTVGAIVAGLARLDSLVAAFIACADAKIALTAFAAVAVGLAAAHIAKLSAGQATTRH